MPLLRPRPPLAALALVLAAACGEAGSAADLPPVETPAGAIPPRRTGGPLANAGPDRQVLEGQVVRLDAGSSQPGESGRPLRYLWTVEPTEGTAVPLAIDDPTARRIRLVAPVLAPGEERAEVRLRLRVDDGVDRAEDVVRLEVVRGPELSIAPVASAGPDLQVVAGHAVVVGPRPGDDSVIDPACGSGDCPPPEITWTLVEGKGATITPLPAPTPEDGCLAPCARVQTDASLAEGAKSADIVAVLSFRVDVTSAVTGLSAAPDFVRLFVKRSPRLWRTAPTVILEPKGPWYTGGTEPVQVYGPADEPLGFRPILGEAEPVPGIYGLFRRDPPDTPSLLGWAFEGREGRLRSAPRFLLVDWRGLPAPSADAGPDPVHLVDGESLPPDGCDRARLVGAGSPAGAACGYGRSHPDLEFCWVQTHGPAALAGVPAACGERADVLESGSQLAGCDSDLACPDLVIPPPAGEAGRVLAFELKLRRRARGEGQPASAWSPPDTAAVHVIAGSRDDPPAVRLALSRLLGDGSLVPLAGPAAEGETVVLDASGSVDPEGRPLEFALEAEGDPAPVFTPHEPCAVPGACFAVRAPAVVAPTTFPFSLTVAAGEAATTCGAARAGGVCLDRLGNALDRPELAVADTVNEPPVPIVPAERVVAPGSTVHLDAGASHDPNGDPLAFAWTVLAGGVTLEDADTAAPWFVAPAAEGVVILELRVTDDRGGEARVTVRIEVRAEAEPATVGEERHEG